MPHFEKPYASESASEIPLSPQDSLRELKITAAEVAAEHWEAYNALTPQQHEVIRRLGQIENAGNFSNKSWQERFDDVCKSEAQSRRARQRYARGLPSESFSE